MIMDRELVFTDVSAHALVAQPIIGVATTHTPSTDSVDTRVAGDAMDGLWLVIQIIDQVVAAGGAATVTFALETHTSDDFAAVKTVMASVTLPKATLAPGYEYRLKVPPGALRWLNVAFTVNAFEITAGSYKAFLTNGITTNRP